MNRMLFLDDDAPGLQFRSDGSKGSGIETNRQACTATAAARLPVGLCPAWMGSAAGFLNYPLSPERFRATLDKTVPGG